jgi:3-oxoacyl-[acyl-carrier protein] reductase
MTVAVVTGAARGIGRAIVERLAADGYDVLVADLDGAGAHATAELVKGRSIVVDVADVDSVRGVADAVRDSGVDVLVNNAGIWRYGPLDELDPDEARRVLEVNVLGAFLCVQQLAPLMPSGAAIVNVASTTAFLPPAGVGIYPASKGAIVSLTRSLAVELGPRGIRVNAVAPGLIRTEGTEHGYADGTRQALGSKLPLGRHGDPADVADVVGFLASPDSRYVTGQVLCVDGGFTLTGLAQ